MAIRLCMKLIAHDRTQSRPLLEYSSRQPLGLAIRLLEIDPSYADQDQMKQLLLNAFFSAIDHACGYFCHR